MWYSWGMNYQAGLPHFECIGREISIDHGLSCFLLALQFSLHPMLGIRQKQKSKLRYSREVQARYTGFPPCCLFFLARDNITENKRAGLLEILGRSIASTPSR